MSVDHRESKMKVLRHCMLILSINFVVKIHCHDINLLKEYFTTSLLEENREILSQPLTEDIEAIINRNIQGFRHLTGSPNPLVKKRTKRDTSNNEIVQPSGGESEY